MRPDSPSSTCPCCAAARSSPGGSRSRRRAPPSTSRSTAPGSPPMRDGESAGSGRGGASMDTGAHARSESRSEPRVTVLALIGPGEEASAPELVADVRSQSGVRAELVLVDRTEHGGLVVEGARVVRCDSPSRGRAWRCGLEESHAEYVAWLRPGCRLLPAWLAHAVATLQAQDRPDIVTCDYFLSDDDGRFVGRSHPGGMGAVPGPYWESGVVMRREVLATIGATAFHPIELELWQRLHAAGRAAHVTEPGFSVLRGSYDSAWERSRHDGALLALAERPFAGERPELTVSICTSARDGVLKDGLMECLAAFARQLLPRGTFEIVLVIDGPREGTSEQLAGLEFPVPVRVLQGASAGLAAARNTGLEVARGRLVLFASDDTIPFPDCVERHIRTHAELGPEQQTAVVGSIEQPQDALGNALARHLEQSTEVFSIPSMKPREFHDGFHFSTGNVSVPLAAVRRAGGFDPSFSDGGCEGIDLALRLELLGTRVYHEPAARALHRRPLDFERLRRRQRAAAQAYVRLFRKHPEALSRWGDRMLTAEQCHRLGVHSAAELPGLERAACELAGIDVGALEALGGTYRDTAGEVVESLGELLQRLGCAWALQGYLEGFRDNAIAGFPELLAAGEGPHPISSDAPRKLLAWPRWDDPTNLDRLMEWAEAGAAGGFAALVLRRDPVRDPACSDATAALEAAYGRRFTTDVELEIVLEDRPLDRSELLRLGRSVDALLVLGGEPREFLATIGAERLRTPAEVAGWRRRFASAEPASASVRPQESIAPELTVIVPTRDRPRELSQLLDRLARQDLAPARFEVIVVDDGSDRPASAVLT
ncbi:MAG: glycosyltransferase, partial [Planctomycetota bacterium]